jgi:hypothetical protein
MITEAQAQEFNELHRVLNGLMSAGRDMADPSNDEWDSFYEQALALTNPEYFDGTTPPVTVSNELLHKWVLHHRNCVQVANQRVHELEDEIEKLKKAKKSSGFMQAQYDRIGR